MGERFFDGIEGAPATAVLGCPACGGPLVLDAWRFVSGARTGDAIGADAVEAFGLVHRGQPPFVAVVEPSEHLYAYVGDLGCPRCGAECEAAIGLAEIQPARYAAISAGVRLRPPRHPGRSGPG